MALLHYLYKNAAEFGIALSALNCDHGIRGASSASDSRFVEKWCSEHNIPLKSFKRINVIDKSEASARAWRLSCYEHALKPEGDWQGADAIATAHHSGDNAETVLFNLARGGGLCALTGITDVPFCGGRIIRPLINSTRAEIDGYIKENQIPFVDDETNFTRDYTRNKIRLNVLPELEKAVHGAESGICRFSRIAAEDENFIYAEMQKRGILQTEGGTAFIKQCEIKPLFARAAVSAVREFFKKKDYTLTHVESLYELQFAEVGKRFEFLSLAAYKEEGKIAICQAAVNEASVMPFADFTSGVFGGLKLEISITYPDKNSDGNFLKFDADAVPQTAVIRTAKDGDKFKKFGGGTKSLGDFFTDKKIPIRLRKIIPLIADGNEILAVCGVEISDKIKVTENTREVRGIICNLNL
ncbi:MAG: tRNA lysidine(34) synthetase TilS [Clostridia bacterium]|nr:tRNA lysidine(34) synthetase TilS [Clostridia bacterium]